MKYLLLLGRVFYAWIFLKTPIAHFSQGTIDAAAKHGVPMANILVPVSGLMAGLGALLIILGYKAKFGAWLIILFLIPVTFTMHNYWTITDPQMHQMQMGNFIKNMSLLGAAMMIAYFGSGPLSIDKTPSI